MALIAKAPNRWLIVLGSTAALIFSNGPILFFTFAVFLRPISEAYGWSRATMSLGLTFGIAISGLATPLVGRLIDRWGLRRTTLGFVTLFAASFAAISLSTSNVYIFILLYAVCGLFGSGHAPLPYAKAISSWFESQRGLALGIAMAGVGVGIATVPQIAQVLIGMYDWRTTYMLLGLLTWLVAFSMVFLFVRDPVPETASGTMFLTEGDDVSHAFRRTDFWLTLSATFLVVASVNGVNAHLVALLTDRGVDSSAAASMLVAVGLSTIVGRLVSGYLLDRIFAPYLAAGTFIFPLLGIALLIANVTSPALILIVAICLGLALGAEIDIIGFVVGRYFGLRRYGEIYGYIFVAFNIGSGLGPFVMGASYARFGNYTVALSIFSLALAIAVVLISLLGPYKYISSAGRH